MFHANFTLAAGARTKRLTLSSSTTNLHVVRIAPLIEFVYVATSEHPSSDSLATGCD
jgi:hypothetical protein